MVSACLQTLLLLPTALLAWSAFAASSNETAMIRDYFYVGGSYVEDTGAGGEVFANQMYVEHLVPPGGATQKWPLVFIHGQGQSGTNWLNKPDGTEGWASWFIKKGYEIYITDQPSRARAGWWPDGNLTFSVLTTPFCQELFTAPQLYNLWPQAKLHTQWPGNGTKGDPIFDFFYKSQLPSVASDATQQVQMQSAGVALLQTIGPAVLVAHSHGGMFPWLIADSRPDLVKAIVSIEPTGPPFENLITGTGPARKYGLTDIPLTYHPKPTNLTAPLSTVTIPSNSSDHPACIQQTEPARQLVNLKKVPILFETSDASFHAYYDDCTVTFMEQAGVKLDRLKLADIGIHGTGHMQFMEKTSDQIATALEEWIKKTVG